MTETLKKQVWAVLAVLGALGSLLMGLYPDLATPEEATTLVTYVPTMVLSTITVGITIKAILVRRRERSE